MNATHLKRTLVRTALAAAILATSATTLMPADAAQAATPPIKLVLSGHITGGFEYPSGVAVNDDPKSPQDGNVYVTDIHNRVQEFTATGTFVAMFGWEVNKTKVEAHAPQAERNVCTAESKDTCQTGVRGSGAEAFNEIESVTVDPSTGNIYVQDHKNWRVDEYTAEGQFVLMIGGEVNETNDKKVGASEAEKNVCTAESKDTCKAGVRGSTENSAHGMFDFESSGGVLAEGGPEDLLYVGDEHRVQEFKSDGTWAGEISLASLSVEPDYRVRALALDQETGDVYLVYSNDTGSATVREFDSAGNETASFAVDPRLAGNPVNVKGIEVDSAGHLAVAAVEASYASGAIENIEFGVLYDAATGHPITTFTVPSSADLQGMAFDAGGALYAASTVAQGEVLFYTPEPVAELSTGSAVCAAGGDSGSSVTLDCTVEGHANPYSVTSTRVWLEWGATCALGSETAKQALASVTEVLPVHAMVAGLRPDSTFCYRLAGDDANVLPPEQLTGEKQELKQLPSVPPRVIGAPSVLFVHSSSAVMFGELNPENADTTYEFQYAMACGAEEVCPGLASIPGVAVTGAVESNAYGKIGATLEATGLRPATVYRYRLHAINEAGEQGECFEGGEAGCEGSFTTAPAPVLTAMTEGATAVGATSAVISGSVDPDGQLATYAFELGVYQGAATQFGVVQSGSTETVPVTETLPLSGLQPGTEYAYRITIASGYGTAVGQPVVFRTGGLPSVLEVPAPLAMLATPNVAFPGPAASVNKPALKCKAKYTRNKQGECVKPKSKKKRAKKAKKAEKASARRR